jgi:copper(I)-binding protein
MKIIPRALILTILLLITTACAGNETVTIQDAWARPGFTGDNSAVYFKISNITGLEDVLIGAKCDIAAAAEIHLCKMDNAGTMTMERQEEVSVPANSQVEFKPGDLHVMLVNLTS